MKFGLEFFFDEDLCILTLFPKWDHKVSMGFRSGIEGVLYHSNHFFSQTNLLKLLTYGMDYITWNVIIKYFSQRFLVKLVQHVSINCKVHSGLTCVQHSSAWRSHAAPKHYASSSKFYSWNHTIRMKYLSFPTANINRSRGAKNLMKKKKRICYNFWINIMDVYSHKNFNYYIQSLGNRSC